MDDAGNVTQNGQQDVDEEIGIATSLKEDTERREDDGKDDLADIAGGLLRSVRQSSRHKRGQTATYERHSDCGSA